VIRQVHQSSLSISPFSNNLPKNSEEGRILMLCDEAAQHQNAVLQ
jgi:hypothetical protein